MTDRLYYADSYTRSFTARIVDRLEVEGRPAIALDRTCFYPTSGGQPCDAGQIDGVPVVDVRVQPGDGAILHVLGGEVSGDEVRGEIDWARRFDHMQQHTGQHILSQAFLRQAEAETVSFHLSENSVTIDLDARSLPSAAVDQAEEIANQVVVQDAVVRAWFPSAGELAAIPLRRAPEGLLPGALRVVAIGDFDYNACGGTHVAHTGEIGLIKIIKVETFRRNISGRPSEQLRVEFCCGWRALADYRRKNETVNRLAAEFTCGPDELPQAVSRLQSEARDARRALQTVRETLLDHEAALLIHEARTENGWRIVRRAWEARDPADLRALASRLTALPDMVALLGSAGPKSQVVLARAQQLAPDMRQALQGALAALGSGRGGGNAAMAQGGGPPAELAQVEHALAAAEQALGSG